MKISENPSPKAIRWRWHCLRLAGLFLMLSAIWHPHHMGMLISIGIAVFITAYAAKSAEEDLLLEVFDEGANLRLALGEKRATVSLAEIEEAIYQDGGDGKDLVVITFLKPTPFGLHIELAPQPVQRFNWDVKLWLHDLNMRIADVKSSARHTDMTSSSDLPFEPSPPAGQVWM